MQSLGLSQKDAQSRNKWRRRNKGNRLTQVHLEKKWPLKNNFGPIMHLSDYSCAPILQFFDAALDGATANRQIPDRIFGHFFTSLRKDSVANYVSIWTLFFTFC